MVTIKCLFDLYSVCYKKRKQNYLLNVCLTSKILFHFRYTVSVRVEEKQPYRQRTYTWCWSIPFRCSKYKIRIKTIYRTEVSKNISATIPNFSSLKYAAFNLIWCWNVYSKVISTPYYCLFVIGSKLKTYLFNEF